MPPRPTLASRRRRLRLVLLAGFVAAVLLVVSGWAGWRVGLWLMRDQPWVEPQPFQMASKLHASDGTVVYTFAEERRDYVKYADISPLIVKALIATEDAQFFDHHGINPRGLARAIVHDLGVSLRTGHLTSPHGGSSLTQQLAKLLFLSPEHTWKRKVKEAILALQLEKRFSKTEILELYLNKVFFGHQRHGVEAAAQFYFGKSAKDVTLPEAALLAGIPQRPSAYSPIQSPKLALERRNHVLDRMVDAGFISRKEADAAKAQPIQVNHEETARKLQTEQAAPFFVEDIRRQLVDALGDQVNTGGLDIQTTLDLDLQRKATRDLRNGLRRLDKQLHGFRPITRNVLDEGATPETWSDPVWLIPPELDGVLPGVVLAVEARKATIRVGDERVELGPAAVKWTGRSDLRTVMKRGDVAPFRVTSHDASGRITALELEQDPELEASLLAMDAATGEIVAMVGGYDYRRSQFNKVTQAHRQVGSAIKPVYYSAALAAGMSPATTVTDDPTVFVDTWTGDLYEPQNYEKRNFGRVTLRTALEESMNVASVRLLNYLRYDDAIALGRKMGISAPLKPYPSLALGSFECTLLELVRAYSVFPNQGLEIEPTLIRKVVDAQGNVVMEHVPKATEVLKPDVAYQMASLMMGVCQRGTAADAARLGRPLAGKTGTTDDYSNAWFIGYTPSLVVGVWVGYEKDLKTIGPHMTGARAALPIWEDFMADALEDRPVETFAVPSGLDLVEIDRLTGLRASPECPRSDVIAEAFRPGEEPTTTCGAAFHDRLKLPICLQRFDVDADGNLIVPREDQLLQLEEDAAGCTIVVDPMTRRIDATNPDTGEHRSLTYRPASNVPESFATDLSVERLVARSPLTLSRTAYSGVSDLDLLDGKTVMVIRNEGSRYK